MSLTLHAGEPGFTVHEDLLALPAPADWEAASAPSEEEYEADDSVLTSDEIIPTIEGSDNKENAGGDACNALIKMPPSSPPAAPHSSKGRPRQTSSFTAASRQSIVSSLPSSLPHNDNDMSAFTPMKDRPAFHNALGRDLQMASPLGYDSHTPSRSSSHLRDRAYRTPKSERRYGSPQSKRTRSNSTLQSSRQSTPAREVSIQSVTPSKKDFPLVLLHVTVLPQPWPYSTKSMAAVLPEAIITNQRQLEERLNPTVLARGLLVAHPREEYDLLEERILESLELKIPRVLKCGHYYREDSGDEEADDNVTLTRGCPGVACELALDGEAVFGLDDHCMTCHGRWKMPGTGVGHGNRRWDIKIYAANGLMRAGAWAAAWSEMERVDVEIGAWMPEHLRRELDQLLEEEEQEALRAAQAEKEEISRPEAPNFSPPTVAEVVEPEEPQIRSETLAAPSAAPPRPSSRKSSRRPSQDVPLSVLLQNYLLLLAKDRRNIAVGLLSLLVLVLSMAGKASKPPLPLPPLQQPLQMATTVTSVSSVVQTAVVTVTETPVPVPVPVQVPVQVPVRAPVEVPVQVPLASPPVVSVELPSTSIPEQVAPTHSSIAAPDSRPAPEGVIA